MQGGRAGHQARTCRPGAPRPRRGGGRLRQARIAAHAEIVVGGKVQHPRAGAPRYEASPQASGRAVRRGGAQPRHRVEAAVAVLAENSNHGRIMPGHARVGKFCPSRTCHDGKVPTLTDLARNYTSLSGADLEWLHSLVSDWQLLADLSFADLILWVPVRVPEDAPGAGWVAVAQMRPTTGPTSFPDDVVGSQVGPGERPLLDTARTEQRIWRESDPDWTSGVPVRAEAIPVTREGRAIAVTERSTNLNSARTPSRLELTYVQGADDLARMVSEGTFPYHGQDATLVRSPRVGDGLLRLDAPGRVTYASPNAQSAYRRLGLAADLMGAELGAATAKLSTPGEPVDESLMLVSRGRAP